MAYKVFTAGTEGLASDVNTYLMNQTVMVFTNAAARDAALTAPTEGMFAYLTASDHYTIYNGSAWVITDVALNAWTPTLTGFTLGTGSVTQCYYARIGKTVVAQVYINMGTGGGATAGFQISLPVDQASSNRSQAIGTCFMRDVTGAVTYAGNVYALGSAPGTARMQALNAAATYTSMVSQTAAVPFNWNNGAAHYFSFTIMYQGV